MILSTDLTVRLQATNILAQKGGCLVLFLSTYSNLVKK